MTALAIKDSKFRLYAPLLLALGLLWLVMLCLKGTYSANGPSAFARQCDNPFLQSYSKAEMMGVELSTRDFLNSMYRRTMTQYDALVSCVDEGKAHPTTCPLQEPTGPHVQYSAVSSTMACHDKAYFGSTAADGRKAVCSASALVEGCVVYSLGSNNDFSFEDDILARTPCTVHTFDCTIGKETGPIRPRLHFHNLCIAGSKVNDTRYATIPDIMTKLGHDHVHLMKMDIEGYEQTVFAGWQPYDPLPDQLVVEIHGKTPPIRGKYRDVALAEMQLLVGKLLLVGYRIAVIDLQPGCSNCVEVTMIRTVCHSRLFV